MSYKPDYIPSPSTIKSVADSGFFEQRSFRRLVAILGIGSGLAIACAALSQHIFPSWSRRTPSQLPQETEVEVTLEDVPPDEPEDIEVADTSPDQTLAVVRVPKVVRIVDANDNIETSENLEKRSSIAIDIKKSDHKKNDGDEKADGNANPEIGEEGDEKGKKAKLKEIIRKATESRFFRPSEMDLSRRPKSAPQPLPHPTLQHPSLSPYQPYGNFAPQMYTPPITVTPYYSSPQYYQYPISYPGLETTNYMPPLPPQKRFPLPSYVYAKSPQDEINYYEDLQRATQAVLRSTRTKSPSRPRQSNYPKPDEQTLSYFVGMVTVTYDYSFDRCTKPHHYLDKILKSSNPKCGKHSFNSAPPNSPNLEKHHAHLHSDMSARIPSNYVPGQSYLMPGRAAPSVQGETLLERFTSEKDKIVEYFTKLISKVDKNQLVVGVSLITTIGIGGAAAWYYQRKRAELKQKKACRSKVAFNIDETSSPVKIQHGGGPSSEEGDGKQPGVLVLHQCPRGRKTPCIAPYPLKLETFLRVNGINYEVDFCGSEPRSQGSPWITLDLEDISDSQNCLQYIIDKFGVDPEKDFQEAEKAVARAYNHLLENHLYWGIALWRWVYDGARSLGDIQLLPKKTLEVIPDVCRTVEQAAWFHGLGKKTPKDVIAAVNDDLKSLSEYLGTKKFFLGGDRATELDCTAFAMLSQMLWNMEGSPYHKTVKETYENLSDFCWRMRVRYWPDWDNCLNNTEVPED